MKLKFISSFLILIFLSVFNPSSAQFIKKLKKAASRGVENALEEKVEEEVNKYVQKQLEKQLAGLYSEDGESTPVTLDMNKILAGIGEEVPTKDSYSFNGFSRMEVQTTEKNGKADEPMELISFLTEEPTYTAMQIEDVDDQNNTVIMIFDLDNNANILLMENEGQKSSFAYGLDLEAAIDEAVEENPEEFEMENFSIEKTGNTKDILGYACEEFEVKTEDGEGTYWMTVDPIEGFSSFWGKNSPFVTTKTRQMYGDQFSNLPEGNFMEMDFKSNDGSSMTMKVLEIDLDSKKEFVMAEYPNLMTSQQK
ncbi:DUF4412 domain-containing protein [Algoriphagus sediminis]|uniref:DUF4412 domain-containing protein n=1 Tax=Algoriphagus sediminis TaxID=3057113 RepID=A0ABT7YAI0_9BACT|nr:DUF4412 domain-containing protein [Algoriphagus sediminis]MDN3203527.1 DUF4412 domain-containing protein [Algoriphagus sediminis]